MHLTQFSVISFLCSEAKTKFYGNIKRYFLMSAIPLPNSSLPLSRAVHKKSDLAITGKGFLHCPQKWLNLFFFLECKHNIMTIWDRQEFSNQTKPSPYRNTLSVQVSTQQKQTIIGRGENRNDWLLCFTNCHSRKKDYCVLFSDSEWSTTKSAWKSTIPFSLLHPQCTMGYDKFLPAPNC